MIMSREFTFELSTGTTQATEYGGVLRSGLDVSPGSYSSVRQPPIRDRAERIVSDASVDSYHSAMEMSPGSSSFLTPNSGTKPLAYDDLGTPLPPPELAALAIAPHSARTGLSGSATNDSIRSERAGSVTQLESPTLMRSHYARGNLAHSPRPSSAYYDDSISFDPSDPDMWTSSRVIAWLDSNSFGKDWQDSILEHKIEHSDVRSHAHAIKDPY